MSPHEHIKGHEFGLPTVTEVVPHAVLKDPEDYSQSLDTPASAIPEFEYPAAREILRVDSNIVAIDGIQRARQNMRTHNSEPHAA
jgi:hypothetical protein